MMINTDNKAIIYNCKNETINSKSKHIDIKYHHIRKENRPQVYKIPRQPSRQFY
jgi:hypothetical protein